MNIIKHKRYIFLLVGVLVILSGTLAIHLSLHPRTTQATGDASFSLSPTSGSYTVGSSTITLAVSETSSAGDNTNAVQFNLNYPSSLTYVSTSLSGPFTLCAQNSHTTTTVSIACASSTATSGTQPIANINFSTNAAGSASVAMASGSNIDSTSGSSVWNGNLPSVTYAISNPPAPSPTTGGTTSGSSTGSSSGGETTTTTSPTTKTTTTTPAATPSPTATTTTTTTPTPTTTKTTTTSSSSSPTTNKKPTSSLGSLAITIYSSSGKKLVNTKVVMDNSITVYTNKSGIAYFDGVKEGSHKLTVIAAGEKPYSTSITLASGQNKLVNFRLSKASSSNGLIAAIIILLVLLLGGSAYPTMRYIKRRRRPTLPEEARSTYFPQVTPVDTQMSSTPISPLPVTPSPSLVSPMTPPQPNAAPLDNMIYNNENIIHPTNQTVPIQPIQDTTQRSIDNPLPERNIYR